ncbi:MAG: hypothetical protein C4543_08435 [Ignavibacteriales bacterium]|jgi:hypothetical protein|nr:MAG: hypothetical protein C4543_08435 [Ignavibacteriales bacterium]
MPYIKQLTILIILLVVSLVLPLNYLIHFSLDDAYFYLKIADNISSGFGSTFDQINMTNGYHPLWVLVLSIYFFLIELIVDASPEILYRATFVLTVVISFLSLLYIKKMVDLIKSFTKYEIDFTIYILLSVPLIYFNIIGFELQLYILLLSIYFYLYFYDYFKFEKLFFFRSILISLVILSRIDFIVFLYPFLLSFEVFFLRKHSVPYKYIIPSLLVPLLVYLAYIAYNYLVFGSIITTSGSIEMSSEGIVLDKNLEMFLWFPYRLLLIIVIVCLAVIYFIKTRNQTLLFHQKIFVIVFISGILFILIQGLFNHGGVKEWYYATSFFGVILLFSTLKFSKKANIILKSIFALGVVVYFSFFRVIYYEFDDEYEYAKTLNEIANPDETIFQFDHSGIISFFSDRQIINGDGLVNSFEYKNYISKYGIKKYLDENKIDYYSGYSYSSFPNQGKAFQEILHKSGLGTFEINFTKCDLVLMMSKNRGGKFNRVEGNWYLLKLTHE